MNKNEIFEFMTCNPVFFLATNEGVQPRVRGMLLYRADENGILFHSARMKELFQQICENSKVELCFSANGTQIRVYGDLEMVEDQSLKEEMAEHPTRKFLKAWRDSGVMEDFYENLVVYRLQGGTATIWTMETNFHKKVEVAL